MLKSKELCRWQVQVQVPVVVETRKSKILAATSIGSSVFVTGIRVLPKESRRSKLVRESPNVPRSTFHHQTLF
jgi:hypothetical protein